MDLNVKKTGTESEISISGAIDEVGAEKLEQLFGQSDISSSRKVILDFRNVEYIGSSGVGTLLLLYKKIAPANGEVIIRNIPKTIYRLLAKDMNLGHIFRMQCL
ncbi:MAG: STAS domain-containing protein [Desulfococcaceae bacterium]|jgi:anti-sigma B factor antagonist|nr:STAS domain-containing protein [Desulfococcaceae bacterium]